MKIPFNLTSFALLAFTATSIVTSSSVAGAETVSLSKRGFAASFFIKMGGKVLGPFVRKYGPKLVSKFTADGSKRRKFGTKAVKAFGHVLEMGGKVRKRDAAKFAGKSAFKSMAKKKTASTVGKSAAVAAGVVGAGTAAGVAAGGLGSRGRSDTDTYSDEESDGPSTSRSSKPARSAYDPYDY